MALLLTATAAAQTPARWLAHDMQRQRPPVVAPGKLALPAPVPSDAVVLFDGGDLSQWRDAEGGPAKWTIREGVMESVPDSGYIYSAGKFGDVQLHVEWAAPVAAQGRGQGRGNSGVFLMGLYEVQVLDSYQNETYADGQAAAIYGQYPPLANACLPPGEWQCYDIVFRRPRFDDKGQVSRPARITVVHNGVLVQDSVEIWGPTAWLQNKPYDAQADRLPLALQDHGNPVRFRNIWLRELRETAEPAPTAEPRKVVQLSDEALQKFVGTYKSPFSDSEFGSIDRDGSQLRLHMKTGQVIDLLPLSSHEFALRWTAGTLDFSIVDGRPTQFTLSLGGEKYVVPRVAGK